MSISQSRLAVKVNCTFIVNVFKIIESFPSLTIVFFLSSFCLSNKEQDLTTYGELVSEASFRMLGAKASRHLLLFDKMLLITKKKEDGTLSYKAHIMVSLF